ncbi:MAG: siroheme synthase CysG [Pseudomonadota bacterium]
MKYFPLFHDLRDAACLVVGGNEAAARKVRLLRRTEARLHVVAPELNEELAALAASGDVEWHARRFRAKDLEDKSLVIAASGDERIDGRVSRLARARRLPVNLVDRPALSSFIVPGMVDRNPVTIAIGSGGSAPVLVRQLRERIEALLPARLGDLARFADRFRPAVKSVIPGEEGRRHFWSRFFRGPVAEAVLQGDDRRAVDGMLTLVNSAPESRESQRGSVALVGVGPGDPDLLTFRALRLMQEADVVVHDRLISEGILDCVRRDAERIHVGKAKGAHSMSQDEINRLLVQQARSGKLVVRLKGGDPFIFGRGGEEQAYLQAHEIAVQVVPGITAATGCAATAGIPLTHRDMASAVTFATGYSREGLPDLDWQALAAARQTLVIYMGVSNGGEIARRLMDKGLSAKTPIAVVEKGTLPDQRVLGSHLADLGDLLLREQVQGPAVLMIGSVAASAQNLMPAETPLALAV